jgi:hypothetical protein
MEKYFDRKLTRREFLIKAGLATGVGLFTLAGGWEIAKRIQEENAKELISNLQNNKIIYPTNDIPCQLRGFYSNMVNIYDSDKATWGKYIREAKELGAKRGRISISDNYEPELGKYRPEVLDRVADFAGELEESGMGLEIDCFDCYSLGNGTTLNLSYPPIAPTSPYNLTRDINSYRNFFTDKTLRAYYSNRVNTIMTGIKNRGVRNIDSWTPANEPMPKYIGRDGKEILTEWYKSEAVPAMRSVDNITPVLSGTAKPWDIDFSKIPGLTANTAHVYLDFDLNTFNKLIRNTNEPIVVQEFGTAYQYFNVDVHQSKIYDYMSLDLAMNILNACLVKKKDRLTGDEYMYARISSYAGWKLAPYIDGYTFEKNKTDQLLRELIQSLQALR